MLPNASTVMRISLCFKSLSFLLRDNRDEGGDHADGCWNYGDIGRWVRRRQAGCWLSDLLLDEVFGLCCQIDAVQQRAVCAVIGSEVQLGAIVQYAAAQRDDRIFAGERGEGDFRLGNYVVAVNEELRGCAGRIHC